MTPPKVKTSPKKRNPFTGFLLLIISIILFITTCPFGLIFGFFHKFFTAGFNGVSAYYLKIAISIDQLGNVLMQHFLNALWIKKDGYKFGNRDETISSAIGKNKQKNTLTSFGIWMDTLLDTIDSNHSLNSIDYFVEPNQNS